MLLTIGYACVFVLFVCLFLNVERYMRGDSEWEGEDEEGEGCGEREIESGREG